MPPGDLAGLQAAVEMLTANPELRRRMGEAGRAFAEANLGREQVLRQFEMELQKVARGSPSYSLQ